MRREHGQIWDALTHSDLLCLTTNSALDRRGALIMGAGIAREARERFPGLAARAGEALQTASLSGGDYGLLLLRAQDRAGQTHRLGLFQTKRDWRAPADPDLIRMAAGMLAERVQLDGLRDVHLNCPGVGLGGLAPDQVWPLLTSLPDAVTVWTR